MVDAERVKQCNCTACALESQFLLLQLHPDKLLSFVERVTTNSIGVSRQQRNICEICGRNHIEDGNYRYCLQCQSYGRMLTCDICDNVCYCAPINESVPVTLAITGIVSDDHCYCYCETCLESCDVEVQECQECLDNHFINDTGFYDENDSWHEIPFVFRGFDGVEIYENEDGEWESRHLDPICSTCRESYHRCCHCDRYCTPGSTVSIFNRGTGEASQNLCRSCLSTNRSYYTYCDDCESYMSRNSACSCYSGTILEYAYRPPSFNLFYSVKRSNDKQSVTYGVELEASFSGENLLKSTKRVLDHWGYLRKTFMYAKYDGTVSDGVEFVTHPFTWRWFQENKEDWANFFVKCDEEKFNGDDTRAGMHVHIARNSIRGTRLYSILRFIHGNPYLIETIGRRRVGDGSNMERYAPINETQKGIVDKVTGNWNAESARKYTAVNLKNSSTIEFRFFKGVRDYRDFRRNMEFCRALVEFSKISGMNIWPHTLARFVISKSKTYPVLAQTFSGIFGRDV